MHNLPQCGVFQRSFIADNNLVSKAFRPPRLWSKTLTTYGRREYFRGFPCVSYDFVSHRMVLHRCAISATCASVSSWQLRCQRCLLLSICKLIAQLAPLNAGHFVNCYSARPGLVLRTSKKFICLVLAKISHPVTYSPGMVGSLHNNDSGERRWKLNLNFKRLSERRVIKILTDLVHKISGYLS